MTGFGQPFGDQLHAGATDAERRVEEWAAQVAEKAQRYQAMQAQVAELSVTEHSGDGAVRLTVSAAGVLTGLELTDRAAQLPPHQLSALIMDTMRRAQGRLPGRVAEVMQANVGDDTDTVNAVVASYQQRFPEQPEDSTPAVGSEHLRLGTVEDEQTPPPPRRPRPRPTDEDEGWGDRPLMRE